MSRHRAPDVHRPGDHLVVVGAVVFVGGVLAVLADVTPFLLGHPDQPLALNLAAVLLLPAGLGLALLGLLHQARDARRRARELARR